MSSLTLRGDLTVKVISGSNLQNLAVFGACNPYVLLKLRSSVETLNTTVKDGESNPTWQDTFTFRNVRIDDALQVSLMEKGGAKAGVVSVSKYIPTTKWGFPATGPESVIDVTMPPPTASNDGRNMGTIRLGLRFKLDMPFRRPFALIRTVASKTGSLTEKARIDAVVGMILHLMHKPVLMIAALNGRQKIAAGGAATVVGGGMSLTLLVLAIPLFFAALLFLPLTLAGGFFAATLAVMMLPLVLLVTWLLICTKPVQNRIWQPFLFWTMVTFPFLKTVLIKPSMATKEQ